MRTRRDKMLCRPKCLQTELENQFYLLPNDDFFNSLPTWTKLEQYFRVNISWSYDTIRCDSQGLIFRRLYSVPTGTDVLGGQKPCLKIRKSVLEILTMFHHCCDIRASMITHHFVIRDKDDVSHIICVRSGLAHSDNTRQTHNNWHTAGQILDDIFNHFMHQCLKSLYLQ